MNNQITTVGQLKIHLQKELKATHISQHALTTAHCTFLAMEFIALGNQENKLVQNLAGLYRSGIARHDSFTSITEKLNQYEETGDSNQEYIWHFLDFFRANPHLIVTS